MEAGDDKGSWDWLDFNEPPWGNSEARYVGAALAAVAIGSAPGYYTAGADAEIDARVNLLRNYLKDHFHKQNLHNQVYGLWATACVREILTKSNRKKRDRNSHIGKFMSDAGSAYAVLALTD